MNRILRSLGPGLITGASDDDPSGIGTYSQAGAQFGFGLLWTLVFSLPLMCAAQIICARVGRVTGTGLADNLRRHYSRRLLFAIVFLLFVANTINLGADLAAMGASLKLIVGGSANLHAVLLALFSVFFQIVVPYHRYVRVLKWLTISLFAYVVTAFVVQVPWHTALHAMFWPHFESGGAFWGMVTAVLGTTISPYLFFWQASLEREDLALAEREKPLLEAPNQAKEQFARIRLDTLSGMGLSNVVAFFIMLTTAVVLHAHGQTQIESADQAAEALCPLAGHFAFFLFAAGIVGTGLLAIPVLAGSAAYALGEALEWKVGMEASFQQARAFYCTIAAAVAIGLALLLAGVNPIKALYWSAVVNGVLAGPLMGMVVWLACDKRVMGRFTLTGWLRFLGWATAVVMIGATIGMFVAH